MNNVVPPTPARRRGVPGECRRRGRVPFCVAAIALLAAACSGSAADLGSNAEPDSVARQEVTSAPTTVPTSPGVTAATRANPLDLVGIGDSFIGWSTVAEQYAELLAEERGAPVSVDKIVNPTSNRLEYLRTVDSAKTLLSEAEIVIVQPQPGPPSAPAWSLYFAGDCGGPDNQDCLRSAQAAFELYIGDLFDEVIAATPDATIILATLVGAWGVAAFNPGLEERDPETFRLFVDHVLALQGLAAEAAAERGIAAVDVSLAFHGPDAYLPAADGYLLPDRTHLTDEGSRVVAELLLEVTTSRL